MGSERIGHELVTEQKKQQHAWERRHLLPSPLPTRLSAITKKSWLTSSPGPPVKDLILERALPAVRSPSQPASVWGWSLHPSWQFPDGRPHWGPRRRGGVCLLGWSHCTASGWSPPHAHPSSTSARSSVLSWGGRKTGVRVYVKVLRT